MWGDLRFGFCASFSTRSGRLIKKPKAPPNETSFGLASVFNPTLALLLTMGRLESDPSGAVRTVGIFKSSVSRPLVRVQEPQA